MEVILVIAGIIGLIVIHSWYTDASQFRKLKPEFDKLEDSKRKHLKQITEDHAELDRNRETLEKYRLRTLEEIDTITRQRSIGFPWLASVFADYTAARDRKAADYLYSKKHPAKSSAEVVMEIRKEKRLLEKQNRLLNYKVSFLVSQFPWLDEFISNEVEDDIPKGIDELENVEEDAAVRTYLSKDEYKNLDISTRNQMALDRYIKSRKSNWALGRDYEMSVGYDYEQNGFEVEYKGIIDNFDDLGRDVIAKKEDEVCIIQCKYWAQWKTLHEKHIFQLFGTTMEYWLQQVEANTTTSADFYSDIANKKIRPVFFTSTKLSERAKKMAETLGIEVRQEQRMKEFPRIKCNVNYSGNEVTRIYHLPMDQQYDRIKIKPSEGDFLAYTVKEAEEKGFRRAFKHRFTNT